MMKTINLLKPDNNQPDAHQDENLFAFYHSLGDTSKSDPQLARLATKQLAGRSIGRSAFPLVSDDSGQKSPCSLFTFIDKQLQGLEAAADHKRILQRHLFDSISRQAGAEPQPLAPLWEKACQQQPEGEGLDSESRQAMISRLAMPVKSLMISAYSAQALTRLIEAACTCHATQLKEALAPVLGSALRHGRDLLRPLQEEERLAPQQLQSAIGKGGDEIDTTALALILQSAGGKKAIAPQRLLRIQEQLNILQQWEKSPAASPLFVDTIKKAEQNAREQLQAAARRVAALQMVHLESQAAWQEQRHGAWFKDFAADRLSAQERQLAEPVLCLLDGDDLTPQSETQLWQVLNSDLPVKIVITTATPYTNGKTAIEPSPLLAISRMATALNRPYVLQAPLALLPDMSDALLQALTYAGPALLVIYHDTDNEQLNAASSAARLFPAWSWQPGTDGAAGQWSLTTDTQAGRLWPRDDNGDKDTPLTAAEWLLASGRHNHCFIQPAEVPETILAPDDWLQNRKNAWPAMEVTADEKHVPVLLNHTLYRYCRRLATDWLWLQDLALGRQAAPAKTETVAPAAVVQSVAPPQSLSDEETTLCIVQRIVSGLLSEEIDLSGVAVPRADAKQKTAPAEETPAVAVAVDKPYIDTALCTSCNECTNINNRMFAYNENKQAYIKDPKAGTFKELVTAAERCPVRIIHPGKPLNPAEAGLDKLIQRAEKFN